MLKGVVDQIKTDAKGISRSIRSTVGVEDLITPVKKKLMVQNKGSPLAEVLHCCTAVLLYCCASAATATPTWYRLPATQGGGGGL